MTANDRKFIVRVRDKSNKPFSEISNIIRSLSGLPDNCIIHGYKIKDSKSGQPKFEAEVSMNSQRFEIMKSRSKLAKKNSIIVEFLDAPIVRQAEKSLSERFKVSKLATNYQGYFLDPKSTKPVYKPFEDC